MTEEKRQEVKCPKCGKRGGVRARKDAYADHKMYTNGEWEHVDTAIMDETLAFECFECGEELDEGEIEEANELPQSIQLAEEILEATPKSVVTHILGLSSGTLTTLTGIKHTSDIDYIAENWVIFAKGGLDTAKTWQKSWHNFIDILNKKGDIDLQADSKGKVDGKQLLHAIDLIQKGKFS